MAPLQATDMGGLMPEKTPPGPRRWVSTLVVFIGLIGGGMGLGYWLANQQAREDMFTMQRNHLAEIARLQGVYRETAAKAATAVQQSAAAVQDAAQTASQAAQTAERAVNKAQEPRK